MTTYVGKTTTNYQSERRNWLLGTHGTGPGENPSITLDVSAFTPATHYPNGFIPSGTVLGRITATGLYAPYDNAFDADPVTAGQQGDGREVAAGILFSSVTVPNPADTTKDVGGALLQRGDVDPAKLPFATAAAGTAGKLDDPARADLNQITFAPVTP